MYKPPEIRPLTRDDGVLREFVKMAERNFIRRCGITLYCSGIMVSGYIVSSGEYFMGLSEAAGFTVGGVPVEYEDVSLARGLKEMIQGLSEITDNADFIHLHDVRIVTPTGIAHYSQWRGRLAAIDGFNLGLMEHPQESQADGL